MLINIEVDSVLPIWIMIANSQKAFIIDALFEKSSHFGVEFNITDFHKCESLVCQFKRCITSHTICDDIACIIDSIIALQHKSVDQILSLSCHPHFLL